MLKSVTGLSLDTRVFQFVNDTDGYGNIVDRDLHNDMTINFADLALMKQRFFSADACRLH